ncbi:hypothetical protein M2306_001510 [Myroides gitamensis]|uniref:Uncharacterized protein n=1 Tax=Myroides odoratus TaxID=256 RepID=A0A378RLJ1_MYROD|nr:hypothetical protein [Myroides odoratus]MDH6600816.1 hypothetical protein [Myroides gitamensis]STZ27057.1 Uncharacterised protein [Myroides odoratus]
MRNALDGVVMHTLLGVQVVYGLFLLKNREFSVLKRFFFHR